MVRTPTASRWVTDSSVSATRVSWVCGKSDLRGQHVSLDYAAHEADSDDDYAEQDDYTVEKILAQRPNASAPGGLEFKVRWRGYGPSHDTWEPVSSFVPRMNTPFMDYSARTRPRSMSRTWQHSPGRLQPGAPDHRPELSPDAV